MRYIQLEFKQTQKIEPLDPETIEAIEYGVEVGILKTSGPLDDPETKVGLTQLGLDIATGLAKKESESC